MTPGTKLRSAGLAGLLLAALCLRLPSVTWALPRETHAWTYHPDEPLVLWLLDGVRKEGWGWVPEHHIGQPTGYGLLVGGIEAVLFDTSRPHLEWAAGDLRRLSFLLRSLSLAGGLLSILVLDRIGRALGDETAGLLAAAFWSFSPLATYFASFHTVNEASLLPILVSIWAWVLYDIAPSSRRVLAASLCTCLAVGMKYTAAPLLAIGLALALLHRRPRDLLSLLASLPVLLLLLPFLWLAPRASLLAFARFFGPKGIYFNEIYAPPLANLLSILRFSLPGILLPAALAGLLFGAKGWSRPGVRVLALWAGLFGVFLILFGVRFARHALPWLPVLLLLAGGGLPPLFRRARWGAAILGVLLGITFISSGWVRRLFLDPETRDRAEAWVIAKTPPGARIGMAWYFWTPHLRGIGREVTPEFYPFLAMRPDAPRYDALLYGGPEIDGLSPDSFPSYGFVYHGISPSIFQAEALERHRPRNIEDLWYVSPDIWILVPRK